MRAKMAKKGKRGMAVSQLRAQIVRDSETVSKISPKARDGYGRELKATLDRGSSYRFSASGLKASTK